MSITSILCDGCGQPATPGHLARRFKRLEQTTHYRPVHIQMVFLGAVSPTRDEEFLYSPPESGFRGEAEAILRSAAVVIRDTQPDTSLMEFQKQGLLLTHVLECPVEHGANLEALIATRLPIVLTRLKRSLKPKRVLLVSPRLAAYLQSFRDAGLEVEVSASPISENETRRLT